MGWPGPMTHRQFLAFDAWLDGDYDRPSRADFYAMQVAAEVRRSFAKHPQKVQVKDFELEFEGRGRAKNTPQRVETSKQVWLSRLKMRNPALPPKGAT